MVAAALTANFSSAQQVELAGHHSKVSTLDWSCNGEYLATGAGDTSILVWKLLPQNITQISTLQRSTPQQLVGGKGQVYIAWHPKDPERFFSLDQQAIRFWDHRSGKITSSVTTAAARNKQYMCATWAPHGHEVLATSKNNYNVLIDTRKSAVVKAVQANAEVNQAAISADGTTMLQGLGNGHIQVLDYPSLEVRGSLAGHMERVVVCRVDYSGRYFMSGSYDSTATLWDYDTLLPVKSHFSADWQVTAAALSHDSQYLAFGGDEKEIRINEAVTGNLAHIIPCHGTGYAMSWHPKQMLLAYRGREDRSDRALGPSYVNIFAPSTT